MLTPLAPTSPLAIAREYIRNLTLPEDLLDFVDEDDEEWYYDGEFTRPFTRMSADILSKSLGWHINVIEGKQTAEDNFPTGCSKIKGRPHLPPSVEWPVNTLFLAQLNLAELSRADTDQLLPSYGMLYFFFHPDEVGHVIYYDGPEDILEVREYPEEQEDSGLEFYLMEYKNGGRAIKFQREAKFHINYIMSFIPDDIRNELLRILGCKLSDTQPACNIFGRPAYWQSEDKVAEDEYKNEPADIMLLQNRLGEGTIHFWISPADLANRIFTNIHLDYSGT